MSVSLLTLLLQLPLLVVAVVDYRCRAAIVAAVVVWIVVAIRVFGCVAVAIIGWGDSLRLALLVLLITKVPISKTFQRVCAAERVCFVLLLVLLLLLLLLL